VTETKVVLSSE